MGSPPAPDAVWTDYAKSLIRFKARQLARKPEFSRSDEEDVAQELTVILLAKAHLFDPARASLNMFIDRVINSAVATLLRDRRRQKRAGASRTKSLDGSRDRPDEDTASLRDFVTAVDLGRRLGVSLDDEARAELVAAVFEACESLPPDLQAICRRLMQGSAVSVARDMGISRRQLRNQIERIRRRFEQAGLADG